MMPLMDWIRHHLIEPLLPDGDVPINDALYRWMEGEHDQLRRQLETERDIILRRARERSDGEAGPDHDDH